MLLLTEPIERWLCEYVNVRINSERDVMYAVNKRAYSRYRVWNPERNCNKGVKCWVMNHSLLPHHTFCAGFLFTWHVIYIQLPIFKLKINEYLMCCWKWITLPSNKALTCQITIFWCKILRLISNGVNMEEKYGYLQNIYGKLSIYFWIWSRLSLNPIETINMTLRYYNY